MHQFDFGEKYEAGEREDEMNMFRIAGYCSYKKIGVQIYVLQRRVRPHTFGTRGHRL